MTCPRVSVVVPVRNRARLLSELLAALEHQTFTDFETIVVDDGSSDESAAVARAARPGRGPVRLLSSCGRGAVAARCLGAAAAEGEILAFTDSDCAPEPGWLAAGVRAFESGATLVKGTTRPAKWPLAPFERSVASYDDGLYPTCNVFYSRELYQALGGFDTSAAQRLRFRLSGRARDLGFGEDTLLAWRARRAGAVAVYEPSAVVEHQVFPPDPVDHLHRTLMAGAFPALLQEVPELGPSVLRHGFLLGERSRVPLYATLLAALARRHRLSLLAGLWWAAVRARDLRSADAGTLARLGAVPIEMMIDVCTAGTLVAGSLRARRVVL